MIFCNTVSRLHKRINYITMIRTLKFHIGFKFFNRDSFRLYVMFPSTRNLTKDCCTLVQSNAPKKIRNGLDLKSYIYKIPSAIRFTSVFLYASTKNV